MRKTACALAAMVMTTVGMTTVEAHELPDIGWGQATTTTTTPRWHPSPGVRMNNPLGSRAERRVILDFLIKQINRTPPRSRIRIMTWNIRSYPFTDALIRAHQRGVSVRILIDAHNNSAELPNPQYNKLRRALSHNGTRTTKRTSWARMCWGSCRGRSGIAHTKMYLFEHTGDAYYVSNYGSANATDLAAAYQWNDMYTTINNKPRFDEMERVFNWSAPDKPQESPYIEFVQNKTVLRAYPYYGVGARVDPILDELNRTGCRGATGGTGTYGRTRIRMAQTAMTDERGLAVAARLKKLYNAGCDVKIAYAMFGRRVLGVLRGADGRGPIPLKHLAVDWNEDGLYDRYLHSKVLTISGVNRGLTNATVTINGTSNITTTSLQSDELVMRIQSGPLTQRYERWFRRLWLVPIKTTATGTTSDRTALGRTATVPDPYALMELN